MSTESSTAQVTPNAVVNTDASQPAQQTTLVTQAPSAPAPLAPETKANDVVTPQADSNATTDTTQASTEKPTEQEKPIELKLPEGSLLTAEELADISTYAKEKGLSQDVAQELLVRESEVVAEFHAKQVEQFQAKREEWKNQVVADKELGGNNLQKNVELAHRALEKFGSPALKEELEKTGYGNHPEIVRLFSKIGQVMANDVIMAQNSIPSQKKSIEEVLYGSNN